jgi:hypothetical protein
VVGGGVVYGLSCAVTVKETVAGVLDVLEVPVVLAGVGALPVDEPSWMFSSCGMRPRRVMNSATS